MTEHYFDISGQFIAFRRNPDDKFVFSPDGNWLGWIPFEVPEVYSESGDYIGTLVSNRLVRLPDVPHRGYPGYPAYPGYPGYPGYPDFAGHFTPPPGARDIAEKVKGNFQYLYNSVGEWIAFRVGQFVWDSECNWMGWMPFDDDTVMTPDGDYLGAVVQGDLLLRQSNPPRCGRPARPGRPGRPGRPARPGRRGRVALPAGWRDLG